MRQLFGAPELADLLSGGTLERRLARVRSEGLADVDGLEWLMSRAEELGHDQPQVADAIAELCAAEAVTSALPAVDARASYLRARILAERGDLRQAIVLIDRARDAWLASAQPLAALRTDLGRMQILGDSGSHDVAVKVGLGLLRALDQLPPSPGDEQMRGRIRATALNNLGASYSRVGDHEQALSTYEQAATAFTDLGMRAEASQPLANRGIGLLAQGHTREALEVLEAATQAFAERGDRLWAAKCSGNLAQAHQQLGQLTDALRVLGPAQDTLEELGAHAEAARLQLMTADVYLAAGLYAEAATAAAASAERTGSYGLVHDTAMATFTLALARLESGGLAEAERQLTIAARLFEQVGDRHYRARVMLAQSWLADRRHQPLEAAAWADAAVENLRPGGWLVPLAWASLQRAYLAPAETAALRFDEAGALVETLDLPELHYAYRLRLARQCASEQAGERAEALLRAAVDTVEQLGSSLPEPSLRSAFRSCRLDAHDELVDLLVKRGRRVDLVEACQVGDRAKAQVLTDLAAATVGSARRTPGGPPPGADLLLEQRRAELSATYNAVSTTAPAAHGRLLRRADRLEHELSSSRLRRAVRRGAPGEAVESAWPGGDGALPLEPAVAFHVVGDDVIAFVVSNGDVEVRRLEGVLPAVSHEVKRLTSQWQIFRMGSALVGRHHDRLLETTNRILGSLHQLVFAPIADLVADLPHSALTVVPHRQLNGVPFHALHDGERYLNERMTISLRPTLGRRGAGSGPPPRMGDGVLVLAVPDARAPSIATEAERLARLMPTARLAVGAGATSTFLREQLPGTSVLHLACHGLYRAGNPLFSSLHLADRWVNAAEILELQLDGALVTLSGCESGRSDAEAAEPIGLAWAFLAAGASGAIVSQWVVDDDTTAELMADMYAHLAAGSTPAAALRLAQLTSAATHPHPFHWAPFVHVASPAWSHEGVVA